MYKNLKALRESLKMTQEEFGKSLGIAKSTYNNYEIGEREPKSDFWIAVAQKYNVSIDYLMGYTNDPCPKEKPSNSDQSEPEGIEKTVAELLLAKGYISSGTDLGDEDFAFIKHWFVLFADWFSRKRTQSQQE